MQWKVICYFREGKKQQVYSGRAKQDAMKHFNDFHPSGALRIELLRDGELYDCRGLPMSHAYLRETSESEIFRIST